jgi:hypothetical protein
MGSTGGWFTGPTLRVRLRVVAIAWVIIGAIGACGTGFMLVPDWRAAHGGGVTGTFALTEPMGCDRLKPPRQRCGWFGDFRSDDGQTIRAHMELSGGLPAGAQVGDTLAARDTGSLAQIYQIDDSRSWRSSAGFFAAFFGGFVIGIALLQPWTWRDRLRQRRAPGR